MHPSALYYGKKFFELYSPPKLPNEFVIVEIGSQDVNGSLRDISPKGARYIGLDFSPGKGVDVIIQDPYKLPLEDCSADMVLSSSCFEHSEFFWLVFLEAMRVLKEDGVFYLNVPSNGFFHRWPVDCWRFYPDSGSALVNWAARHGYSAKLLESFTGERSAGKISEGGMWRDFVAVFIKNKKFINKYSGRIISAIEDFSNGYSIDCKGIINKDELGPDFGLIEQNQEKINQLNLILEGRDRSIQNSIAHISHLEQVIQERDLSITNLRQESDSLAQTVKLNQQQIGHLEQVIQERDLSIQNSMAHVSHLEQVIQERDLSIAGLDRSKQNFASEVYELRNSRSWRFTSPLRVFSSQFKKVLPPYVVSTNIHKCLKKIYVYLPINRESKLKLKSLYYLFCNSDEITIYQMNKRGMLLGEVYGSKPENKIFDYDPEGYHEFKNRLSKIEESKKAFVQISPPQIIHVKFDEIQFIAQKMSFDFYEAPVVSILIPVYNNINLTIECLLSIAKAKNKSTYEIIIADDCSTDQTKEILATIKGIKVYSNSQNLGFLRNCNATFRYARGAYTVFLNNDVQVMDGWLDEMVKIFDLEDLKVGAVGPKIIYPSGYLQEAGVSFRPDGLVDMVGLNDDPGSAEYNYSRSVDYCSGAALMVRSSLLKDLGGFDESFAPAYCEDADLCMQILKKGFSIQYSPDAVVVHHLSKSMANVNDRWKLQQACRNIVKFYKKWFLEIDRLTAVRLIAFYLPQFHEIEENNKWWGNGFTEWKNVVKARPNFIGHRQPREPANYLGYYNLMDKEIMLKQFALARQHGINGFCYYYYWFNGKRLLEAPIERLISDETLDFPFCLCWANENWTRRWDGNDNEILIGQNHCEADDVAVINDLIRYFKAKTYIKVNGRPVLAVYRVDLFPNFKKTANVWREVCRRQEIGEIYLVMVESHDLVHKKINPSEFGCDASIEFPPLNMAEQIEPSGSVINENFSGAVGDYQKTALAYCARPYPNYKRFRGVMPGWDNTARRQNNSFCFEGSSPGIFQAWLEFAIEKTRHQMHGDEQLVFINAWNEWAEGAYLEPDKHYGTQYLEAVRNAVCGSRGIREVF